MLHSGPPDAKSSTRLPRLRTVRTPKSGSGWRLTDKPSVSLLGKSFPQLVRNREVRGELRFIAYILRGQIGQHASIDRGPQTRSERTLALSSESFPTTRNPDGS